MLHGVQESPARGFFHGLSQSLGMNTASSNVDPAELAKFSALAHRWWDTESEFAPLHHINPLRLGWIESLVGGLADKQVLDVGCGGGILADAMARRGAQVLGIDLADKSLKVAQLHALEAQTPNIAYRNVAVEQLAAEEPQRFDVVTCMEMLEHVPDPASVVQACAQLVKPGGMVFLSTINRNPWAFALAIVGAEYVLNMLPRGTHEYARFITPAEMAAFCRAAGMSPVQEKGLEYNPLTKRYRLTDNVRVNYMMAVAVPQPSAAQHAI